SVDETLAGLRGEEVLPLWAFHHRAYHCSYRVALALRRLVRERRISGVEFPEYEGLGYVALKWRRLLGDELAGLPMWVRVHGSHEVWQAADGQGDDRIETHQLHAMERYGLEHADGWVGPSAATLVWTESIYRLTRPHWHCTPRYEHL